MKPYGLYDTPSGRDRRWPDVGDIHSTGAPSRYGHTHPSLKRRTTRRRFKKLARRRGNAVCKSEFEGINK